MNFASGYSDAIETVAFAPDGSVVVGGFVGSATPAYDQKFKSGGQPEGGHPFIAKISAADVNGNEAPFAYEWYYYETDNSSPNFKGSAKAVRVSNTGEIYAIMGKTTAVIKFSPGGQPLLKTGIIDNGF